MINIFMFAINLSFYSFLNLKATTNSVEKKWEYKTKQNKTKQKNTTPPTPLNQKTNQNQVQVAFFKFIKV